MTLELEGMSGQQHGPAVLYPGKDPVPIVQEAGWAPGPVWTGGKSRPTGIRSSGRPARNQWLYRLSYHSITIYEIIIRLCPVAEIHLVQVNRRFDGRHCLQAGTEVLCSAYVFNL